MIHLATVKGPVRDVLMRAGLYRRLGERIHPDVDHAMRAITTSAERSDQP